MSSNRHHSGLLQEYGYIVLQKKIRFPGIALLLLTGRSSSAAFSGSGPVSAGSISAPAYFHSFRSGIVSCAACIPDGSFHNGKLPEGVRRIPQGQRAGDVL